MTSLQVPGLAPRGAGLSRRLLGLALRLSPFRALANLVSSRRFVVQGASMEPALAAGRYLLVSRAAYWLGGPERGDIVVVRDPRGGDREYIKRVVGLPGEQVRIQAGRASIDGQPLDEPYLKAPGPWASRRDGQWLLGGNEYLVLGDSRDDSLDSRAFGPVPARLIVGKAWLCYWPRTAWGRVRHGAR